MALINSLGALGSFAGSYLVGYLNGVTGTLSASYLFMSGALLVSVVLTLLLKPDSKVRPLSDKPGVRPTPAHS